MTEDKKIYGHSVWAWVTFLLLGFILIALVFKAGMVVGSFKSYHSSYKTSNYQKDFRGHSGRFSNIMHQKKARFESLEVKAKSMGMTVEEFKNFLIEQKKAGAETKVENE